jgi:dTDP-4-amino-4,6-dideoxygalactose transaminase
MITTHDVEWADKIRTLSLHGMNKDAWKRYSPQQSGNRWEISQLGYKYNLTDIQAALGIEQLKRLDESLQTREQLREKYMKALAPLAAQGKLVLPGRMAGVWHLFAIRLRNRDEVQQKLKDKGVITGIHFRSNAFAHCMGSAMTRIGYLDNAETIGKETLSLPFHNKLTDAEIAYVAQCLEEIL